MPSLAAESGAGAPPARPRVVLVIGALLLGAMLVAAVVLAGASSDSARPSASQTILVVIPRGTAARMRRHERVDVLPSRLTARAGDRLRVVNRDTQDHTVGPFFVTAHQTLQIDLARAGRYAGACSVHRDRRLEIRVTAS